MAVVRPRGNIVRKPLRWSIDAAAPEFGMGVNTLRKLLNQASVAPGEDGCYSTAQLLSAIYGRMHEEKLKTQEQLTKKYELANRTAEGALLNRDALMAGFSQLADSLKSVIMSSTQMTRTEKEDFLRNLSSWPVIVDGVAARQSKLRRSKNGQAVEEDGCES
jgi:hypothetical protein